MTKPRILIFIVSYNAEAFIQSVLDRIPDSVWNSNLHETEVLVIDDGSKDSTFFRAEAYRRRYPKLTVLYNPTNQGYGGNQKIGFHYAIRENFDGVVLLHGDGQYAPERLPQMIAPLLNAEAELVLGSRMLNKRHALQGGMPLYKWIGNQIVTALQNRLLGARLSEFHTGYRAYRVDALRSVPFFFNSDYFDFDTDIIIQFLDTGKRIKEIPIPTHYGEEKCHVNGLRYCALILRTSLLARAQRWGIFFHPKFDFEKENTQYKPKFGYASSHQFAIDAVRIGETVLDLGCGPGFMARELQTKHARTISVDRYISSEAKECSYETLQGEIENMDFSLASPVNTVLLLDIIEHLHDPEAFLLRLRQSLSAFSPRIVVTTGNIAFLPMRLNLLLGHFRYGKKGILDRNHTRLFTLNSLKQSLEMVGYSVKEETGIPVPFPLIFGRGKIASWLIAINQLLIRLSKGLFSYQIAVIAEMRPTLNDLLRDAYRGRDEKRRSDALSLQPSEPEFSGDPHGLLT